MSRLGALGVYLPPWGTLGARTLGFDEDSLTLAVCAGRAALSSGKAVDRVVLVRGAALTADYARDSAALLGGLELDAELEVEDRAGGAPSALDALLSARPGTLVIGVDEEPAGAAAAVVARDGVGLRPTRRLSRSVPTLARSTALGDAGHADPRLDRARGIRATVQAAGLWNDPVAMVGAGAALYARFACSGEPPEISTNGASSAAMAIASLVEAGTSGILVAYEQGMVTAAQIECDAIYIRREEPSVVEAFPSARSEPPLLDSLLSLRDSGDDTKLRWQATRCGECGSVAFSPSLYCAQCGNQKLTTQSLPRTGSVCSFATAQAPIPGLVIPYSVAIVALEGADLRVCVPVTGPGVGSVQLGQLGDLVFRRLGVYSGAVRYGHAFYPREGSTECGK